MLEDAYEMPRGKPGRPAKDDRTISKTMSIRRSVWEKFEKRGITEEFDKNRRLEELVQRDNEGTTNPEELKRIRAENQLIIDDLVKRNQAIDAIISQADTTTEKVRLVREQPEYKEKIREVYEVLADGDPEIQRNRMDIIDARAELIAREFDIPKRYVLDGLPKK